MSAYFTDVEVILSMPAKEYFARPEISRSELVSLLESPAKFPWNRAHPITATPAMQLGSLVHALTLTPREFDAEYLVSEESSRRTKGWKADVDLAEQTGRECVLTRDMGIAEHIAEAAQAAFPAILEACQKEVAIIATHAETGIRVKARLDLLHSEYVADLKTTKAADRSSFQRSVGNFRYDIQAAFYGDIAGALAGLEHLPFLFACVETEEPYMTAEWDLDEDWIEHGRADYERALGLFKKYEAEGYPTTLGKGTLIPKPWQL